MRLEHRVAACLAGSKTTGILEISLSSSLPNYNSYDHTYACEVIQQMSKIDGRIGGNIPTAFFVEIS